MSTSFILVLRFSIRFLVLILIYYKRLKIIDKRYLIGIFATEIGLLFQNIRIKQMNPSDSKQILSLEVVFGVRFLL